MAVDPGSQHKLNQLSSYKHSSHTEMNKLSICIQFFCDFQDQFIQAVKSNTCFIVYDSNSICDKLHNTSNSDLGVDAELLSTITQTQHESKRSA
jgi:hypothetical protein